MADRNCRRLRFALTTIAQTTIRADNSNFAPSTQRAQSRRRGRRVFGSSAPSASTLRSLCLECGRSNLHCHTVIYRPTNSGRTRKFWVLTSPYQPSTPYRITFSTSIPSRVINRTEPTPPLPSHPASDTTCSPGSVNPSNRLQTGTDKIHQLDSSPSPDGNGIVDRDIPLYRD